jgi:hypothetical protein
MAFYRVNEQKMDVSLSQEDEARAVKDSQHK